MSLTRRPASVKSVMLLAVGMTANIGIGPTVMRGQPDTYPVFDKGTYRAEQERKKEEGRRYEERKKSQEEQEQLERESREVRRTLTEPMERERKLMEDASRKESAWQQRVHALSDFNYALSIIDQVDHETALQFLRFWIDQGNAKALHLMGNAYQTGGLGLAKERDKAIELYTQAAKNFHLESQYALGEIYSSGTNKNPGEAAKWYLMAAKGGHAAALDKLQVLGEAGDVDAQYILGKFFENHKDGGPYAKWFLKAAEQGHAEAQAWVGRCYQYGLGGVSKDSIVAEKWNRKAAERGVLWAQLALAWAYRAGEGVAKNSPEAAKWYQKAAEKGAPEAMNELGQLHQKGDGVPKDLTAAARWYQQAAEKGYVESMYNLGLMHESGTGMPMDAAEAIMWYRKAAAAGHPGVNYHVGCLYRTGRGVAKDPVEAVKWLREAAEKNNSTDARIALGSMYENGEGVAQDAIEAIKWYYLASADSADAKKHYFALLANGTADNLYALACNFRYARDGTKDVVEALKWYRKAAEQGHKEATMGIGEIYYQGDGVARDPVEAMKWFRLANERGGTDNAQFFIGEIYYQGDGVTQDLVEAEKWYRLAANRGHPDAKFRLGNMYERGEVVAKNLAEAEAYYRDAFGYYDGSENLANAFIRGTAKEQYRLGVNIWNGTMRAASHTVRRVNEGMSALGFLRKAVENGSTDAKITLGHMYVEGDGVPTDQAEGVRLIREAVEDGNPDAGLYLGELYQAGKGVPRDLVEALAWYKLTPSSGGRDATAELERKCGPEEILRATERQKALRASIRAKLIVSLQDPVAAMRRYSQESEVHAQFLIGEIYYHGDGVTKNLVEAEKWYRQAAKHWHPDAKFRLGNMYERGEVVAKNLAEAEVCYREAFGYYDGGDNLANAFIRGTAEEQWKYGLEIKNETSLRAGAFGISVKRVDKDMIALGFLRKAAEQGSAKAKTDLGQMYLAGDGVPKDQAEGVRLIQEVAEDRAGYARLILGDLYQKGEGVPQDLVEAFIWYKFSNTPEGRDSAAKLEQNFGPEEILRVTERRKVIGAILRAKRVGYLRKEAENGSIGSKFDLGKLFLRSKGEPNDQAEGVRLIQEIAEAGDANKYYEEARQLLGELYQKGEVVPQDLVEALAWYRLTGPGSKGRTAAAELERKLGPEEVLRATAREGALSASIKAKQAKGNGTGLK